jgi:hypothetical protein
MFTPLAGLTCHYFYMKDGRGRPSLAPVIHRPTLHRPSMPLFASTCQQKVHVAVHCCVLLASNSALHCDSNTLLHVCDLLSDVPPGGGYPADASKPRPILHTRRPILHARCTFSDTCIHLSAKHLFRGTARLSTGASKKVKSNDAQTCCLAPLHMSSNKYCYIRTC